MKKLLIIACIALSACSKKVDGFGSNGNGGGNNGGNPTPTPTATPVVQTQCEDENASNEGGILPCVCESNYQVSSDGKSCSLNPSTVTSVTLSASTIILAAGQSADLTVTLRDSNNNVIDQSGANIIYNLSNQTVGSVVDGKFVAAQAGLVTLTASVGSVTSNPIIFTVTGTIPNQDAARVEIVPLLGTAATNGTYSLDINQTRAFSARVYNAQNQLILKSVTWQSSDTAKATVIGGLVTAQAQGSAMIKALVFGSSVESSITINVSQMNATLINLSSDSGFDLYTDAQDGPQTLNIAATKVLYDLGLSPLLNLLITWQSLDASKVTVSQSGVVTVASGVQESTTAEVRASVNVLGLGLLSRTYKIYIYAEPKEVSAIHPVSPLLNLQLGALSTGANLVALDQLNKVIAGAHIDYSSSNQGVALVDQNGNLATVGLGLATITGVSQDGSKIGTYQIKVLGL